MEYLDEKYFQNVQEHVDLGSFLDLFTPIFQLEGLFSVFGDIF